MQVPNRPHRVLVQLLGIAVVACSHGKPGGRTGWAAPAGPGQPPFSRREANAASRELAEEARTVLRGEGELLWKRYTKGEGALPASVADAHRDLFSPQALAAVAQARDAAEGEDRRALELLHAWIAPISVARAAAPEVEALERARAGLAFAAPGDATAVRGERDLDRLLTDERSAKKRTAIAEAEAKAAAAMAPLVLARDAAEAKAMASLGLPALGGVVEEQLGATPEQLAALAEQTLSATERVAARAVAVTAQQNLGLTADRVRRADLPRMLRTASADAGFPAGRAWESAQATLRALGADPAGAHSPRIVLDAAPSPAKGLRPLALLVDPPSDVRLSFQPAGGADQQRALLHEAARAVGGALTRAPRWELAQLGDGSAAEGVAQLFEQLAGDPLWLRATTPLRGETLDELVHASAARRLLSARRAAALVLFEVRRREQPNTAESAAALYRGLLQRATLALYSDHDAGRWPLETDTWLRAAVMLRAALLAAALEQQLAALSPPSSATPDKSAAAPSGASSAPAGAEPAAPAAPPWLQSPEAAAKLRQIWSGGRSLRAEEAAKLAGVALDPSALARQVDLALSYAAPDPRPAVQKPDYKYMQSDRRVRRRKRRTRH
jgi:hypothetical protein